MRHKRLYAVTNYNIFYLVAANNKKEVTFWYGKGCDVEYVGRSLLEVDYSEGNQIITIQTNEGKSH